MPLKSTAPYGAGLLKDDYEVSVKMSTYLVAFVVCDFKNVSSHTASNTLVSVAVTLWYVCCDTVVSVL